MLEHSAARPRETGALAHSGAAQAPPQTTLPPGDMSHAIRTACCNTCCLASRRMLRVCPYALTLGPRHAHLLGLIECARANICCADQTHVPGPCRSLNPPVVRLRDVQPLLPLPARAWCPTGWALRADIGTRTTMGFVLRCCRPVEPERGWRTARPPSPFRRAANDLRAGETQIFYPTT